MGTKIVIMRKMQLFLSCGIIFLLFFAGKPVDCTLKGKFLGGRVKVVSSGADFKVKLVNSNPDLEVKKVSHDNKRCGEWYFVESFQDFTIQFVDHGEDFTIRMPENSNNSNGERLDGCSYKGKMLCGRVKIVTSFADFDIKIDNSFPDLRVKAVNYDSKTCGEWRFVESFPDFTVRIVESFPDFTIRYVESFPGKP